MSAMKADSWTGGPIQLPWPFVRECEQCDFASGNWRWRVGAVPYEEYDGSIWLAHAMGSVVLTFIADVPLPRPYRDRVAYTRTWIDPDGAAFGVSKVRFTTKAAFARMARGHSKPFDLVDDYAPIDRGRSLHEHDLMSEEMRSALLRAGTPHE